AVPEVDERSAVGKPSIDVGGVGRDDIRSGANAQADSPARPPLLGLEASCTKTVPERGRAGDPYAPKQIALLREMDVYVRTVVAEPVHVRAEDAQRGIPVDLPHPTPHHA